MSWVRHAARLVCMAAVCLTAAAGPATGPTSAPATRVVAPPPKEPPPPPIDLASVATASTSTAISLQQVRAAAAADGTPARVAGELVPLSDEIDARLKETRRLLRGQTSLQVLDGQAEEWQTIDRELGGWHKALDHRRETLAGETSRGGRLERLRDDWQRTRDSAEFKLNHPTNDQMAKNMSEAVDQVDTTLQLIALAQSEIGAELSTTYGVLHDIDRQQSRVAQVTEDVREARDAAWSRLFQPDGNPLWRLWAPRPTVAAAGAKRTASVSAPAEAGDDNDTAEDLQQGRFRPQLTAVWAYLRRHWHNVGLHVGLIAALAVALGVGRRWVRRWAEADPSLNRATLAFTAPVATALVLSFVASVWIYPQAPRLFWAGLGALALLPTVFLLRRVVERRLFLILDALVVAYAVDQVRLVVAAVPLLARAVFLGEMVTGVIVLAAIVRARWDVRPTDLFGWVVRVGARVWLATFAASFVADAVGYVSLAELVGGSALGAGYLAVILYACTRIVGGLLVILLRSRPLTLLASVRRHQPLLLRRMGGFVAFVAALFWGFAVLEMLSARPAVFDAARRFWQLPVHLGAIQFTPSHLLVFALTVYASVLLSRVVQFVLDEDVYGRAHVATGASYAINRVVHYVVVVAGFYLAMATAGVSFTQLNLLVTALTVGLGFGLQNVVNNFVSGLILLFERPIKVGDLVQLGDTAGTVEYIGIRASIITTAEGSEVIVPNGNLLANQLTNWTLTNRQRGLAIPLSLAAEADPGRVMALLVETAAAHPLVLKTPGPTALLVKFGGDSFSYELRAWTSAAERWGEIRSDLAVSLHAMLVREGIGIK